LSNYKQTSYFLYIFHTFLGYQKKKKIREKPITRNGVNVRHRIRIRRETCGTPSLRAPSLWAPLLGREWGSRNRGTFATSRLAGKESGFSLGWVHVQPIQGLKDFSVYSQSIIIF
jgi:hypothetical protein